MQGLQSTRAEVVCFPYKILLREDTFRQGAVDLLKQFHREGISTWILCNPVEDGYSQERLAEIEQRVASAAFRVDAHLLCRPSASLEALLRIVIYDHLHLKPERVLLVGDREAAEIARRERTQFLGEGCYFPKEWIPEVCLGRDPLTGIIPPEVRFHGATRPIPVPPKAEHMVRYALHAAVTARVIRGWDLSSTPYIRLLLPDLEGGNPELRLTWGQIPSFLALRIQRRERDFEDPEWKSLLGRMEALANVVEWARQDFSPQDALSAKASTQVNTPGV